jgi:bifunctional DNA-binding transcriptional regulator/antitoxin component of YhaV-PrlF toxin-antitoxin module
MKEVKARHRRRGSSRISAKHQVTIPVDALRAAGLEAGERVVARAEGPGRVVLEREDDVLAEFAGALTGVYRRGELDALRGEWA